LKNLISLKHQKNFVLFVGLKNIMDFLTVGFLFCITFVFAHWWPFETASCPRDQTKLRKTNYKFKLRPSYVLYIFVGRCAYLPFSILSISLSAVSK